MAQIVDQIAAGVDYVKQAFPGRHVWDSRNTDRSAHTEFLSDNTPSEVRNLLTQWNAANALLKQAGPTKRLLVTRDGWTVTSR